MRFELPPELIDAIADAVAERLEPGSDPAYLTADEAADRIRAKPGRVYELVRLGKLSADRDGRRVLIRAADLDSYLRGV